MKPGYPDDQHCFSCFHTQAFPSEAITWAGVRLSGRAWQRPLVLTPRPPGPLEEKEANKQQVGIKFSAQGIVSSGTLLPNLILKKVMAQLNRNTTLYN